MKPGDHLRQDTSCRFTAVFTDILDIVQLKELSILLLQKGLEFPGGWGFQNTKAFKCMKLLSVISIGLGSLKNPLRQGGTMYGCFFGTTHLLAK